MKLVCFTFILGASVIGAHAGAQPSGSTVALEIANCLLQKAPEQARVLALLKLGESSRIQKEPCGTLPFPRPKHNYVNSELLASHIKNTFAQRVFECAKEARGFSLAAQNFRGEISGARFQSQLANADRKWQKEQENSTNKFPIPAFRKLELAATLASAKILIKSVRQCDEAFVDVNPYYLLSLTSPSLGNPDA